MLLEKILVCLLAGAGAGLGTGFAGLSAAVFITPMLVSFLNVPVYDAVGIALASDVLASAVSSVIYQRNGNIEVKKSRSLWISVLIFCIIGSLVAFFLTANELGDSVLGYWSILCSFFLGISFIFKPGQSQPKELHFNHSTLVPIAIGGLIGFICGFQGAGGGLMLLFALNIVLSFPFKKAVGTSVFIMTFSALIGSAFHFAVNGLPDLLILAICMVATTLFARIGAAMANKMDVVKLKRLTGILLALSALVMGAFKIFR